MNLHIYPSSLDTARALILHIIQLMTDDPNRIFNIAFSGGNTPAHMYDLWGNEYADITPWEKINIWWVDERCVPPEDSASNFRLMRILLFDVVGIPRNRIFRIKGENVPVKEAVRYSEQVKRTVPMVNNFPVFDMVLLGVGADGHTSSIYPGQEQLLASSDLYSATINPYNGQQRIAMTGQSIVKSKRIIFLVTGSDKAEAVYQVYKSGDTSPAGYIAKRARNTDMFLDNGAASLLSAKGVEEVYVG